MRQAILVLAILVGSAAARAPFKSYTSPDAKFSISFPGSPNVSAPAKQKTDEGNIFTEQHFAVADDAAYIVLTADYPFAIDRTALESIAKEQAMSCGAPPATILSDKNYQGRPALLFSVNCPKGSNHEALSLMVQTVADGNRVYRILYGSSDTADHARIDTFLISFHIN